MNQDENDLMDDAKKDKLKKKGYVFTTPADFFGLTEEERRVVELRHKNVDC